MSHKLIDKFYWNDIKGQKGTLTDAEQYQLVIDWAGKARGQNPNAFDALSEWILDDCEWTEDKLIENEQILMQGVIGRFEEQNEQVRAYLKDIADSGIVNKAVWKTLDKFDEELTGHPHDERLHEVVGQMFNDFSVMRERSVRERIAGGITGSFGTDSVQLFGYINYLKDCDAGVQWALFMPQVVERQQDGFKIESFEYKKLSAMRFIGKESNDHGDEKFRKQIFDTLDNLGDFNSECKLDLYFMHHFGLGVDVDEGHGFWGRFMKADTPVPEGFVYFDFIPSRNVYDFVSGPPYFTQFAYATFAGDMEAMHKVEGYDGNAMYDVTRNIILGQGVNIPYPDKYWTAEVFLNGCENWSTAYMFSVEL